MHKSNLVGITHILWIDLSSWCLEFVTLPLFLDVVHLRSCTDSKNEPPVVGPFSFLCFWWVSQVLGRLTLSYLAPPPSLWVCG